MELFRICALCCSFFKHSLEDYRKLGCLSESDFPDTFHCIWQPIFVALAVKNGYASNKFILD
jgi:hypothetical protein